MAASNTPFENPESKKLLRQFRTAERFFTTGFRSLAIAGLRGGVSKEKDILEEVLEEVGRERRELKNCRRFFGEPSSSLFVHIST